MNAADENAKLSLQQATERMESIPQWSLEMQHLVRRISFPDFVSALAYVNKLGALAEKEQHHPDIMFGWGYVELRLTTHDLGGLTARDFTLATKIDALDA